MTENGSPVLSPTLVPASHASKEAFGTVLVLDTSYSMAGEPLAAAVAAEQTFASHRNPNEQLGAINFWKGSKVALPLTTDPTKISAKLSAVPPDPRRHAHLRRRGPGRGDAQGGPHRIGLDRRPLRRR